MTFYVKYNLYIITNFHWDQGLSHLLLSIQYSVCLQACLACICQTGFWLALIFFTLYNKIDKLVMCVWTEL